MIRFLLGSTLLMIGGMIAASAAITVIGLPLGIAMLGAGLELLVNPRHRGPSTGPNEAERAVGTIRHRSPSQGPRHVPLHG